MTAVSRLIGAVPGVLLVALAAPAAADEPAGEGPRTEESIRKGIDWLLEAQRKDGSWGTSASGRPVEVLADVPGSHQAFRVGASALCALALLGSPSRTEECAAASRRGLEYILDHCRVRRPNGMEMYNVWSFAYSLRLFAAVLPGLGKEDGALRDRILERARELVRALAIYQTPDGGWGYYDFDVGSYRPSDSSMTFTTATALVSLHAIEKEGVAAPRGLVDRAILSLRRSRKADGSYIYGPYAQYRPAVEYNEVKGSLGRAHSCNLALWLFHAGVGEDDMRAGIERFFRYHRFIDIGRKRPIPHEAWYYTSGYYFYYGHYYARLVLDVLPAADRERWRPALEKIIVDRQEADGSWWDFPLYGYHKPYGTAYALLTLMR